MSATATTTPLSMFVLDDQRVAGASTHCSVTRARRQTSRRAVRSESTSMIDRRQSMSAPMLMSMSAGSANAGSMLERQCRQLHRRTAS